MPGKHFAVVEEILMTLSLFSEGLGDAGGAKMAQLMTMIKDVVVAPIIQEREIATLLKSISLLRFFALLQGPETNAIALPVL